MGMNILKWYIEKLHPYCRLSKDLFHLFLKAKVWLRDWKNTKIIIPKLIITSKKIILSKKYLTENPNQKFVTIENNKKKCLKLGCNSFSNIEAKKCQECSSPFEAIIQNK